MLFIAEVVDPFGIKSGGHKVENRLFGGKVRRIALDAGFTCPVRDGSRGTGGCLYCDAVGARARYVQPELSVREQLALGIAGCVERNLEAERFVAYFQAYTNTYAPAKQLRALYEEGLSDSRVVGMAIATRPDCLPDDVLDVLEEFSQRTFLWVEIGLQSSRDTTLQAMKRGHSVEEFVQAAERLRARGIRFCSHVILGLPGDTPEDFWAAARILNESGAWGAKIHNLYIDRDAPLAREWEAGRVSLMTLEEYAEAVAEFLAWLSPHILIHRLAGEAPRGRLLAPKWAGHKRAFLRRLDQLLKERDLYQGKYSHPK